MLFPWYVYALAAAFVVAVASVLEKKILTDEQPVHFSFAITVVAGLLSFPFLFFIPWETLSPYELSLIGVVSAASACAFWLVAKATKVLDAGEISALLATTPAAIAVFAFLFLNEALTPLQTGGIFLVIAGLLILELPHLAQMFRRKKLGELFFMGLIGIAVLVYAGTSLIDRVALTTFGIHPFHFIVLTQSMSMVVFGFVELVVSRGSLAAFGPFLRSPIKVLSVAVLLFLARVFYAQAIALVYAALAAALKRTGAIFTILLSGAFLKEKGLARKLAAAVAIVLGAIAVI